MCVCTLNTVRTALIKVNLYASYRVFFFQNQRGLISVSSIDVQYHALFLYHNVKCVRVLRQRNLDVGAYICQLVLLECQGNVSGCPYKNCNTWTHMQQLLVHRFSQAAAQHSVCFQTSFIHTDLILVDTPFKKQFLFNIQVFMSDITNYTESYFFSM